MQSSDALRSIRPHWINRINHRLARGEGVRSGFETQLNQFFDLLLQAVETGNPAWLDSLLDEWVLARPETDLEIRESSIVQLIEIMLTATHEVLSQAIDEKSALELVGLVLPTFVHAINYTSQKEASQNVERISAELNSARASMEKLDKSKSDFISIAAHELRTPLTLIEGYATMLRDRLAGLDPGGHADILLRGIDNGTRRLKEIVDDMLDVSMIDNDLLSLNFQPLWISRLLEMVQRDFREVMAQRSLDFQVIQFSGSQEMTFGDEERLFQAFKNLVSNAVKYTPDGGRIVIDGRALPGFLEIIVSDTGIGIDPSDHAHIFEKFGKLGSSALHSSGKTKFKGGGPGLGLPIAKGIIEAHGGTIWVESAGFDEALCPGTTFHVLLPLRDSPPDEKIARLFRSSIETQDMEEYF